MEPCRRNRTFSAMIKLRAVDYAERNGIDAAALAFDTTVPRIKLWITQKEHLVELPCGSKRLKGGGRLIQDPELDDRLINWVNEQREQKLRVNRGAIQKKAKEWSKNRYFKASNGWVEAFMRRHNLTFDNRLSEEDWLEEFLNATKKSVAKNHPPID